MTKGTLLRIFLCIFCAGIFLYSYIEKQNGLTRLRLKIPVLGKEIRDLKEYNTHLKYEIELFESPEHLITLSRNSEFSHLKHPLLKDIVALPQGIALQLSSEEKPKIMQPKDVSKTAVSSVFGSILPDFRTTFWEAYKTMTASPQCASESNHRTKLK